MKEDNFSDFPNIHMSNNLNFLDNNKGKVSIIFLRLKDPYIKVEEEAFIKFLSF